MKSCSFLRACVLVTFVSLSCFAAEDPSTVLVIVNDFPPPEPGTGASGASVYVGEYYAAKRGIPPQNILHLNVPVEIPLASFDGEIVPFATFDTYIRQPLKAFLESSGLKNKIKYIVPTYGIPDAVSSTGGLVTDGVSVDSYLASLYLGTDQSFVINPYAVSSATATQTHFSAWSNPSGWPMYLVTRLDGPTAMIAAGLVDKALLAETTLTPASGIGYFDWKGDPTDPTDQTMKRAYDLAVAKGFPAVLNNQSITHSLIQSAPNTLWAWGWYSGPTTCACYSFVNGAVGAQLTSYTANRVRFMVPGTWVPLWLSEGITATWGATSEPFTSGYANGDNLLNHFWNGYNFAESAYLASPALNWMMVFVGDPLYSPPQFSTGSVPQTPSVTSAAATPAFNPPGGIYVGSVAVTLTTSTPGAIVHYTLDGSMPTEDSPIAAGPITITASGWVRASAFSPGMPPSGTAETYYTIANAPALMTPVASPILSPMGGVYTVTITVTLATSTQGAVIHYTLDGSSPTENSPVATGSITLTASSWVRARAFIPGTTPSSVVEAFYTVLGAVAASSPVATPVLSPAGGTFNGSVTITLSTATSGATIHYTLDGSAPTENSPVATGAITVTTSGWVRMAAFKSGMTRSDIVEHFYTIQ